MADYEHAIHAIGEASAGRGIYEGPGISIKLSALHPRYSRTKRARVMDELLPRAKKLAALAQSYDIGLNIDAEEADRLELSLDLLEALARDPELAAWNGIGFVVQAYGKRCPAVIDWLIDLGRRAKRRLMVRLVKGAYWDSEIKRAQVDGLADFPVYTRKVHTDVAYLACARKLLAAPDAVFPQFATHNAQTLASVMVFAGPNYYRGQYEFQCLHGMGEPLYEEVVGRDKLDRPCRIYAPVGTHETLLAYLVRRLLENGANTSFVNRIADAGVAIDDLVADPVEVARAIEPLGAPHPQIAAPAALYGPERRNSRRARSRQRRRNWPSSPRRSRKLRRPRRPKATDAPAATRRGASSIPPTAATSSAAHCSPARRRSRRRCACAEAARRRLGGDAAHRSARRSCAAPPTPSRRRRRALIGLIMREAGKSYANAIAEVREAVDFLRYYADERGAAARAGAPAPLGPGRLHQPVEFSAGDLHRPGRRGAGRRQSGARQAGRGDAADRRRGRAAPARGRRAGRRRCNCCRAAARRRRGAGRRPARRRA